MFILATYLLAQLQDLHRPKDHNGTRASAVRPHGLIHLLRAAAVAIRLNCGCGIQSPSDSPRSPLPPLLASFSPHIAARCCADLAASAIAT